MANLHLVTGYAGEEHITSDDQGSFNAAIMGTGEFILERGKQFEASIISNNKVRVLDGDALMQGRHIRMKENTYVDLNFDNGLQGYSRIDLIVIRYSKDPATDIEKANLVVIKGTPVEGDPAAPDHITGDIINEHDLENDTVLYKVPFIGLNIQPLEKVFSTVPTWETLKNQVINNITAKFDALVAEAMQQIADGQKPLVSNIDDMLLIENYGEYGADAKAVGEEFNKINGNLESRLGIPDTSWVTLNAEWGCLYRVRNGFLCVKIMSSLSFTPTAGQRYTLGTIPLKNLGISDVAYIIVPSKSNDGFLLVGANGQVQFETSTAIKWHYAFVSIPVD